ncbi:hypothetical protein BUALT_Bualt15G0109800 [Buddleja alternifolia]|uniref:PGG domain-containing protein n=1 Tax=Buddleja alternifolia TaxID=168488 RepID=A0AAV6WFS0_9LAMI|nr:hypothetical protein BUALT_Bualt15G0109800 [Buddleja alternifolia]
MGIEHSKIVKKPEDVEMKHKEAEGDVLSTRQRYLTLCVPLHKAALKGDWEAADRLLQKDHTLVKARITEGGETALHIAALEGHDSFVANLLDLMDTSDTEIQNDKGRTALSFVAAAGHFDIAKQMVEKNPNLPTIHGKGDGDDDDEVITPLYIAVLLGHKDMGEYLLRYSDFESWTTKDQIALLTTSIDSGLYGVAKSIVHQYHMLAVEKDSNDETPLEVLAKKPLSFCGSNQQGFWTNISSTILRYMKLKTSHKQLAPSDDVYTLFDCLWHHVIQQEDVESAQVVGNTSKLLFVAAESGNDGLLVEIIRRYPDFLYKMNSHKHSIFHIAVLRRYVQVFNLIYELNGLKDLIATYIDKDGNNMLHLAAKLAPQNQLNDIPGAALQMQREVVEKIVQPSYRNIRNVAGQTPHDLFLDEHEKLMKEGEKLMKQTAKSCMLVTMLIATVVFTTAFTVPGGYNNYNGAPILQSNKLFMVFPISEAIATLASLTSMLMFLSILTSRYAETDFLNSLPFWLVIGVAALFVSIVAMMVSFCTCLLFYEHGWAAITILLALSVLKLLEKPSPLFNCKHLTICLPILKYDLPGMASLLQSSPHLETLSIKVLNDTKYSFRRHFNKISNEDKFLCSQECNFRHLKKVNVVCTRRNCFQKEEDFNPHKKRCNFELLDYLLSNARILKKLVITSEGDYLCGNDRCACSKYCASLQAYRFSRLALQLSFDNAEEWKVRNKYPVYEFTYL